MADKLLATVCSDYFKPVSEIAEPTPLLEQATTPTKLELLECLVKMTNDTMKIKYLAEDILQRLLTLQHLTAGEFSTAVYMAYLFPKCAETALGLPEFEIGGQRVGGEGKKERRKHPGIFKLEFMSDTLPPTFDSVRMTAGSGQFAAVGVYERQDTLKQMAASAEKAGKTLGVSKKLFRTAAKSKPGAAASEIADTASIMQGSAITVQLELTIDRDTDYLEINDPLAPFMVPAQLFEGIRNVQGVEYYQVVGQNQVSFFLNHASKGKYVFEYTVFARACGRYRVGGCRLFCNSTSELSNENVNKYITVVSGKL